jgi:hypothetical protein
MNTTHLAFILVLLVVLFTILTQRLLLSSDSSSLSSPASSSSTGHGKFEKLSRLIASRNESLQRAADSMKETSNKLWNKITDLSPSWTIADDNATVPVASTDTKYTDIFRNTSPDPPVVSAIPTNNIVVVDRTSEMSTLSPVATIPAKEFVAVPAAVSETKVFNPVAPPTPTVIEDVEIPLDLIPPVIPEGLRKKQRPGKKAPGGTPAPKQRPKQPPKPPNLMHHNYENVTHPKESPRAGTSIADEHQLSILKCPQQSNCIIPQLQLKIKLKIYLCKHTVSAGVRYYFLTREGLLLHPNVELVSNFTQADFVIYVPGSAPWFKTECNGTDLIPKLIVLDEFDGHTAFAPPGTPKELKAIYGPKMMWYFMYFKRSFVARRDGKFLRYPFLEMPDMYPMTYSIAEAYTQNHFNFVREIDILCTLRGSAQMTTRQRVQDWIKEYSTNRSNINVITKEVIAVRYLKLSIVSPSRACR